jgi:hypothetical protein
MNTFTTVEEFIEVIGGWRDPVTGKMKTLWDDKTPLVSLARYDVKIVESFCEQCSNGQGFTDRQGGLAKLLVEKYRRQLAKHSVVVPEELVFKHPLRAIDRTCVVRADDSYIYLHFPFQKDWIETVRDAQKTSQGNIAWNREKKVWMLDLTEYNVSWAYTFAKSHNFEIEPSIEHYMNLITECEQHPFKIELTVKDGSITVDNADNNLIEYIEQLGGFTDDNLLKLVDLSGSLGYNVSDIIAETVADVYGPRFVSLCLNRELKVDLGADFRRQVKQLVEYATTTGRLPIYLYEPDLSGKLLELFKQFISEDEILFVKNARWNEITVDPKIKMIYTHKVIKGHTDRIPLLVSGAGMMFGGDRQIWLQNAEKIVYFAKDIYNKSSKGREVCKLD